jgi:diguanylate cyclase (GGDEF)-like protein
MKAVSLLLEGSGNIDEWIVPSFAANESCGCPRCDFNSFSKVHDLNNRFYHHQDDIHIMQNLTAVMMCSERAEDCIYHIRHSLEERMFCVIEDACLDVKNDYFLEDVPNTTKTVIYNSFDDKDETVPYDDRTIYPYLFELLDEGYPVIYNVLEYMGKAIGLVAYCFDGYDLIDYSRISGITNCLSMGFGGFVTMRYQKYLRSRIQEMYQNDSLTGLYNRIAFLSKFEELKMNPELMGQRLTIIMADLNGLKQINDNYGHVAGDRAIASVAGALMEVCPEQSLCVRFGGDEMIALVPGEYDTDAFITQMEEHLEKDSEEAGFRISASYGSCSTTLTESLNLDEIIVIADEQMYKMKKEKKKTE